MLQWRQWVEFELPELSVRHVNETCGNHQKYNCAEAMAPGAHRCLSNPAQSVAADGLGHDDQVSAARRDYAIR